MTKPFCFTYSKLKSFETCALLYKHQEILKTPGTAPSGDAIDFGNAVHKALEDAINHALGRGGAPLIPMFKYLQFWVDWCVELPGDKYVEIKWAIDEHKAARPYFRSPWYRLKSDFAQVDGPIGHLVDWKTGKRLDEPLQLWLGAACMFAQFEQLQTIVSKFVWLKDWPDREEDWTQDVIERSSSTETIHRHQVPDIWDSLNHRIDTLKSALDNDVFHPTPGRHCGYCRVQSCPHWGESR